MIDEAAKYHAWDPKRICIKVPFERDRASRSAPLAKKGVRTNVTCLMSFNQAYLAALAGATYVSIFAGRVRDMGYDVQPVIHETRDILDREELASEIIVGSIRHMMDVNEALAVRRAHPHHAAAILRKMLWNPRTDETIREFNTAWANRGK